MELKALRSVLLLHVRMANWLKYLQVVSLLQAPEVSRTQLVVQVIVRLVPMGPQ